MTLHLIGAGTGRTAIFSRRKELYGKWSCIPLRMNCPVESWRCTSEPEGVLQEGCVKHYSFYYTIWERRFCQVYRWEAEPKYRHKNLASAHLCVKAHS